MLRALLGSTLALSAAGCGHPGGGGGGIDGPAGPDAAAVDAAIDAPADAAPRPVTVHVVGRQAAGSVPRAGIPVLFHAPDGSLVVRAATDAAGDATAVVADGSSVTVVEADASALTTIADIAAGDELWVGELGLWNPPLRYTSITLPPGPESGSQYIVGGPCALSSMMASPVTTTLWSCAPASGPMIAAAFRVMPPFTPLLRGYLYTPQVPLQDGGAPVITGTWLPPLPLDVDVTGLPATAPTAALYAWRVGAGERMYLFQTGSVPLSSGAFTGHYLMPGGGDGMLTELSLNYQDLPDTSGLQRSILEYRTGTPTQLADDLSGDLISRPLDVQYTMGELEPGGATGITEGSWTMSGAGDHDGIVVVAEAMTESFDVTRWTVVLPPSPTLAARYRFPRLPTDLIGVWGGRPYASLSVTAADTPATSYAVFRRDAEPERTWRWMRAPVAPAKVRIATSFR